MSLQKILISSMLIISPVVIADQMAAMSSGCLGCHQMDIKTVGPAIKDIAKKHKGTDIEKLVAIVKKGKSGDELTWGTIPMPPNNVPEENIRKAVTWMLTN